MSRLHSSRPSSPDEPPAGTQNQSRPGDVFFARNLDEEPLWQGLFENLRDTLMPRRLPPLQLSSVPVPVPDRMAGQTNPWAIGTSAAVNAAIVGGLLLLGLRVVTAPAPNPLSSSHNRIDDLHLTVPRFALGNNSGGGGGANDPVPPTQGRVPKFSVMPLAPPQIPVLENPKLAVDPAIPVDVKLPENANLPNIGVHSSVNVTLLSGGPGSRTGIGTGKNGDYGPGDGPIGYGPGSDAGVYEPGGDVSAPLPVYTPEAEFSDEARRAKYQGVCMISVIIDAQGNTRNPRVVRSLGMGLDEKALAAVARYRFEPAMRHGKAVASRITVAVDFRLF